MEKERRTKALLLSTLVVVIATLSIAFASLSRTLSINGIGKMDTASWSVYFNDLKGPNVVRGAKQVSAPSISADKGTVQDINVKLFNPKDEISYTVDIVNDGTIDAEITMIKDIELTDAQKKVFEFKVTYTDTGEVLKDGDLLPKDTTKNITINIKFKDDITEFDLPTESQTINLSYQITYTQYDGKEIVGPNGGGATTGKAVLASIDNPEKFYDNEDDAEPFFNCTTITRDQVESISFISNINVPDNATLTVWDASEAKDESIIGWYQDTDLNNLYEVYIGSNSNIYAPENSLGLFALFWELKELNLNNFNTSEVLNMTIMFNSCESLINLDLSSFDTTNVTTMESMFQCCSSLINLDLSSFDTTNVTDMGCMFECCSSLKELNLSHFNTSNVTNMEIMFSECNSLTTLNLNNWDTSQVTDMSTMFASCSLLTTLDLSGFRTTNVIDIHCMFEYIDYANIVIDLRNADFSNVTDYRTIFDRSNYSNFILIVSETQKNLAFSIFVANGFDTTVTIKTPSEL